MEQLAANAERASIKFKQVEFMADHLGEVYKGVISGVTEWGLYVEIEENKYCLVGRRNGNRYRLGDEVQVQVARANLDKKQLDFVLVDEKNPPRSLDTLAAPSVAEVMRSSSKSKKTKSRNGRSSKSSKKSKSSRRG